MLQMTSAGRSDPCRNSEGVNATTLLCLKSRTLQMAMEARIMAERDKLLKAERAEARCSGDLVIAVEEFHKLEAQAIKSGNCIIHYYSYFATVYLNYL